MAATLKEAALVVSVHGGAMANIAYAPVGTAVLEITGDLPTRPCYLGLAGALGFEHAAVATEGFSFDGAPPPTAFSIGIHFSSVKRQNNPRGGVIQSGRG
jgi:hypothetical protein